MQPERELQGRVGPKQIHRPDREATTTLTHCNTRDIGRSSCWNERGISAERCPYTALIADVTTHGKPGRTLKRRCPSSAGSTTSTSTCMTTGRHVAPTYGLCLRQAIDTDQVMSWIACCSGGPGTSVASDERVRIGPSSRDGEMPRQHQHASRDPRTRRRLTAFAVPRDRASLGSADLSKYRYLETQQAASDSEAAPRLRHSSLVVSRPARGLPTPSEGGRHMVQSEGIGPQIV
jgi:hypothetical protein